MMVSPRIARFAAEAADHVDAATRALVDDLRAGHGPLVEVIAGSDRVLVTFVYISSADVVRVSCELWPEDFVNPWLGTDMTRVPGTDVWYASVEADPAVTVPYHFIPTRLSIEKSIVDRSVQSDPPLPINRSDGRRPVRKRRPGVVGIGALAATGAPLPLPRW
jgi:hypothetical protein